MQSTAPSDGQGQPGLARQRDRIADYDNFDPEIRRALATCPYQVSTATVSAALRSGNPASTVAAAIRMTGAAQATKFYRERGFDHAFAVALAAKDTAL